MLLAHKITLDPTKNQKIYFQKACGVSRFSYNWALNRWNELHKSGKKVSEMSLRKELNSIKKIEFPWMSEVTKCAPQQSIKNLGEAFKRFFKNKSRYPKFKNKYGKQSFRTDNGPLKKGDNAVDVEGKKVCFPRVGWVRMRESLRFKGQIKSAIVSKRAGKWFVSFSVEVKDHPNKPLKNHGGTIGVDLGVKKLATLSNGEKIEGPKPHKKLLGKMRRLNKSLSRKEKSSKNRKKSRIKLSKLHYKISNIRNDALNKLTTKLSLEYDKIVVEDLNVSGMIKNKKLSRAIMDQGFYEFRRQLEYKALMYGSKVMVADRFFPSSKTCSSCGKIHNMDLSKRAMICDCGLKIDRDINAAINLKNLGDSSALLVCGQVSSDN